MAKYLNFITQTYSHLKLEKEWESEVVHYRLCISIIDSNHAKSVKKNIYIFVFKSHRI